MVAMTIVTVTPCIANILVDGQLGQCLRLIKLLGKSIFHEYNFNFYEVDITVNKMIPTLLCSMAVQVSQSEISDIRTKTEQN